MDGLQLRDEAVRDRVRAAQEFLDPSMLAPLLRTATLANSAKVILLPKAIDQTSY
jgi:hypothetical protein